MLVYLKQPMYHTTIDGYRVYGRKYAYGSFGATNIPINVYKQNIDILEEASYHWKWLEEKFVKEFPKISLDMSNIYYLDIKVLIKIAHLIGIKYIKPRHVTIEQKKTLCRIIRKVITEEI